jgi:DNA topoisomerase-2
MSKKKVANIPTAADYKHYDQRTHVYNRPTMYITDITKQERDEWLFNDKGEMVYTTIEFPMGCERIFVEILSNAIDNCGKSRRANIDPGIIEVTMDNKRVTVKNYGVPIPIEFNKEENMYVPQLIFGTLLTSSTYETERHEIGTNGIGSKAANIFSTKFEVVIENAIMKKKYTQVWQNNMLICNDPVIEKYTGKTSSVQINYDMDFKYFGYDKYPQEAFDLFRRHTLDASFTAKVLTYFNNQEYNYGDIKDYASLYFGEKVNTSILHTQELENNVTLELLVMDAPDEGYHVSFVNCMMTKDGGVHVDAAFRAIGDRIVKLINEKTIKKLGKIDEKEKKSHMITMADVKPHISLVLACKLVDPDFSSQSKTKLTKPTPKIVIADDDLKPILEWKLIDRLYAALDAKQFSTLTKTDGKMCGFLELKNGNDAGTRKSSQCALMCCEGKSPKGYINTYRSHIEHGTDRIGILPLKGKCLNVMNADDKRVTKNEEIKELKLMLGLKEQVDYTQPENFKKLRYGRVVICADSDVDGKHSVGLIINFFYCRFPSLLKVSGFLTYKRTPILRITKGKVIKKFYTPREYDVWINNNDLTGWQVKYFKGLGTSNNEDVKDDIKDERIVECINDDDTPDAMQLAFNSDLRHERKAWITNWVERDDVDSMVKQPISLFINHEFILFSISNLKRAIPKLMDGCKESHRKILYGIHDSFGIGPLNKSYTPDKVCDLDSYVSRKSNYHHGNEILSKVIINMAQNFVGSNNINLFEPNGQFGTRLENGEDASSGRYLHTWPSKIFPYIFVQDDQCLLKNLTDENKIIEPEIYHTVIPLILVNGTKGVATGFSTYIPCHNPLDIMLWLKQRLAGAVTLPTIVPWYRGFEGTITIIDRRTNKKKKINYDEEMLEEDDDESEEILDNDEQSVEESDEQDDVKQQGEKYKTNEKPQLSFVVTGAYHILTNGNIVITELPIGISPTKYYKKHLVPLIKNKKIKKVIDNCTISNIHFEIKGFVDNPTYKNLHLRKRYSLSNMVLLDKHDKPVRYDTANDIIEAFYNERLPVYAARKAYKLQYLQKIIDKLTIKIKFITAILNKQLTIQNVEKEVIYEQMKKLKIPPEIYDQAKLSSLNKNEITALQTEITGYQNEMTTLSKLSEADLWLIDIKNLETKYKQLYK